MRNCYVKVNNIKYPIVYHGDNKFNPIFDKLLNRHARCKVILLNNITINGIFVIVPYSDRLCLLVDPKLNYHPMTCDIRITVDDIKYIDTFEIDIL